MAGGREAQQQFLVPARHSAAEPSEASLADWVMKMAIHAAIVYQQRKDFGGARILAAREGAQG